jgi:hypothetical protein
MVTLIKLIFGLLADLFRSRASLEAEILVLRQQIIVLRRVKPTRLPFIATDKLVLGWVCRLFPNARDALAIVRPETGVRWHRLGFRSYWRRKSSRRSGRPVVPTEIRQLIREMSIANPLWGAPRIHGELLKLGIDIGQTSVAKYMARWRRPPSQGWKTFLRNHADGIAALDLFVVPKRARICPLTRTHRSDAPFNQLGVLNADLFSAACTTNMREFDLRQSQARPWRCSGAAKSCR